MSYTHTKTEELLEYLIGSDATHKWYRGELRALFERETGVVEAEIAPLIAAKELVARWLVEELRERDHLTSPALVANYLKLFFAGQQHESFVVLFLDTQNRLIVAEELFRGTLSQTSVYPREVVKRALQLNAGGAIFAHNHPSGVADPSMADRTLTACLQTALHFVDVKVIDHVVVGGNVSFSFAEHGMLS